MIHAGKRAVRIRRVECPGRRAWPDRDQNHRRDRAWKGPSWGPADQPSLTSFCCRSSSFILISRASARAARFAANLASACNRPGDCVSRRTSGSFPGSSQPWCSGLEVTKHTVTQTVRVKEGPGITILSVVRIAHSAKGQAGAVLRASHTLSCGLIIAALLQRSCYHTQLTSKRPRAQRAMGPRSHSPSSGRTGRSAFLWRDDRLMQEQSIRAGQDPGVTGSSAPCTEQGAETWRGHQTHPRSRGWDSAPASQNSSLVTPRCSLLPPGSALEPGQAPPSLKASQIRAEWLQLFRKVTLKQNPTPFNY